MKISSFAVYWKLAVTNEIHTLHRLHPLSWSSNYVTCLVDVSILIATSYHKSVMNNVTGATPNLVPRSL